MPAAACCCLLLPAAACGCLLLVLLLVAAAAVVLLSCCCNQTASKARNNCCCCCAHKETRVKGIIPWRAPPCVCRGRRIYSPDSPAKDSFLLYPHSIFYPHTKKSVITIIYPKYHDKRICILPIMILILNMRVRKKTGAWKIKKNHEPVLTIATYHVS